MPKTRSHIKIYQSHWHLLITLGVVVMPFLYLLFFSHFARIASAPLFFNIFTSVWRLAAAYLIAVLLAWACAVLFYEGRRATLALPLFDVLQSFPTFAALPLATFIWGPSNFTVIFFLVLTVIWPIFFSAVSSLKLIKHEWREAVEISHIKGLEYLRLFLIPASLGGIITGSIIGLGEGWEALVATEIIVNIPNGLGQFFAGFSHNTAITSFGILGLLIIIFSINKLLWLPLLEWGHRRMEE